MDNQRPRFDRFRPVTVRAAARLMTMAARGRLAPEEVDRYLRALALTEPKYHPQSHQSLKRLAQRWSAFGNTGVLGSSRRGIAKVELAEVPECLKSHPEINC